jgi:hypothetical protein
MRLHFEFISPALSPPRSGFVQQFIQAEAASRLGLIQALAVTETPKKPGWLIVVGVVAFVVAFNVIPANGQSVETEWLITGVYILGIAALFLLAYFFESESIVFRGLIWVCEHFSFPASRKMAFFYAGLGGVIGTVAILQGFGVINVARHG